MAIVIVGFLIAVAFAIPTFGISLLAFFAIKYLVDLNGISKISAAVMNSCGSGNPVVLSHLNNAAIRMFFNKHGTTEKSMRGLRGPLVSILVTLTQ